MLTRAPDNRAVALKLAAAGYFVFPCEESGEKAKRPKHAVYWRSASTTDAAKINRWWDEHPDALVGLDCGKSGLFIIDADRHGGPDGVTAWEALIATHGDPGGPSVSTPSNGVHYYFRQGDEPMGNRQKGLPPGINVRGHGGYVIAPEVGLPDGRVYDLHGDINQAPPIPGWLIDILDEDAPTSKEALRPAIVQPVNEKRLTAYAQSAVDGELNALRSAGKGTRNETLNRAAFALGTMAGAGWIGRGEAQGWLADTAGAIGLPKSEAAATIRSGLTAGMKEPRGTPEDNGQDDAGVGAESARNLVRTRDATEATDDSVENNKKSRLYLVPFDEIKLSTAPRYLVKEVIPSTGLTVVWGPPKQGKSFWVFDIAMHIALGWEYRGKRVKKGIVVYGCFEGQDGFEARKAAFEREFLGDHQDGVPFFLEPVSLNLVKEHGELIKVIGGTLGDDVPALIVLDTLNRSFDGSESDDKDMTAYVKAADALRHAFQCAVLIVHHCGHDATRPRGHTALLGAVDAQIKVAKEENGSVVSLVEFMKDGPSGACFASTLDQVTVGVDDDGDDITSCIVKAAEGPAVSPKTRGMDEASRRFHEAFVRAAMDYKHPAGRERPDFQAVPLLLVRDAFMDAWATGEESMTKDESSKRRVGWHRALKKGREGPFSVIKIAGAEWIWPHA